MTLQLEPVSQWQADAADMITDHWKELGMDQDLKIDLDFDKMKVMENIGMFKVITARDEGKLAGYALAVFSTHLHYKSSPPMMIIDAYYIAPEYRSGIGVKLFKFIEEISKSLGAIKIYLSCKLHRDHSRLFAALGYTLSDYAFIKRI